MELPSRNGRRSQIQKVKEEIQTCDVLQFYSSPPMDTISLQEFEEFAVERLKVLKAVDTAGVKFLKGSDEYNKYLDTEIGKTNLKGLLRATENPDWKKDHISHFILRLAYCRSEELRRWFLLQELDLFRFRFLRATHENKQKFIEDNNLKYKPIETEEKEELCELLLACERRVTNVFDRTDYYKVPFTEALELVGQRKVYLKAGLAYVPSAELVSILVTAFRAHLSHSLAVTVRALPTLEEDERLLPMLSNLSKRYVGKDYSQAKNVGEVTADMIDLLSQQSFPLCMSEMHQALRRNHHLRHGGRMQYGLFLKGIGLSLDEALRFWKSEFSKVMDPDKFDKQYAYTIRHNYGKEGKRTSYTPYSCMKIITSNPPSTGDFHGCPFRHCDPDLLKQKLKSGGLSSDGVEQVMKYVRGGHYQVACAKLFELTQPGGALVEGEVSVNFQHPNEYFEESRLRHAGKVPAAATTPTPDKLSQRSSQFSQSQSQSTADTNGDLDQMDDMAFSMEELETLDKAAAAAAAAEKDTPAAPQS